MSAEWSTELVARARAHAALGEPARLAIVERLTLGDAAPSELAADLGIASNLLAHHLRVLVDGGLIIRTRSEGDRRRSYVQLIHRSPDTLPSADRLAAGRVVFVCTRHSARSHLAAAAWARRSTVPVASAGTHPAGAVHPGATAAARRRNLRIAPVRTAHINDVVESGDLLVAVCDNAYEELAAVGPVPRLHWAVPDPVRVDSPAAFDAALDNIEGRIELLAQAVDASEEPP
ncbi:MAG: ArsR family transcriptional regulator [Actinomycetota bacterium]|nr:MAG: ArsR family transcriptional regulator [Actinomycetota bacterium]